MRKTILEIDHLITYVEDGKAAATTYQAMGFTLTPPSHIGSMGIANQIILLHTRTSGTANFIELMTVTDTALLPPAMMAALSGRQGIKSMVMATRDAAEAHRELVAAGYPFDPPQHVRREWILPGEASVWPEFDVLLPIPAPLSFNVCQYHNLPLYERDAWRTHPNTAQCLLACFAVARRPTESIRYFESLFARSATQRDDCGLAVSPGKTDIIVYSYEAFADIFGMTVEGAMPETYVGFRIGVTDIGALRSCLDASGTSYRKDGARIIVSPAAGCGNVIEFVSLHTSH